MSDADADTGPRTPLQRWKDRIRRPTPGLGTTDEVITSTELNRRLKDLGPAGDHARALDRAVDNRIRTFGGFSDLGSHVALGYLDRVRHAIGALTMEEGVSLVTRGYLAHMAVEADPPAFGAPREIPVLGDLPDLRKGRPPQDLSSRVLKASRRHFADIRAVNDEVWDGFVLAVTRRIHAASTEERPLDGTVVDGLLRYGWVVRQVDLKYGQEPAG